MNTKITKVADLLAESKASEFSIKGHRLLYKAKKLSGFIFSVAATMLFTVGTTQAQDCNTITNTNSDNYTVTVATDLTGLSFPVNTKPSLTNSGNVISPSTTDYATISGGALGGTASITVKYGNSVAYPANTFAGFEIREGGGLLSLGLIGGLKIQTLDSAGTVLETKDGAADVLDLNLLTSSNNTQYFGFTASQPFSQIRITYKAGLVSLLNSLRVYGAVVKKMCENPTGWACNTVDGLVNPAYPVNIDMKNTGITGTGTLLGSVINAEHVIDNDSTNYATISGVNAVSTASITVKKELSKFVADSNFVGFDIEAQSTLLAVGALGGLSVSVMKNGVTVDSIGGTQLLTLSLFSAGGNRVTVGFVPTVEFDAIKLSVIGGLASTSLLSQLRVYGAVVKHFCPVTTNPDVAVTNINVPVSGNVSTNDDIPNNTTYSFTGTPTAPTGSTSTFTINPDGTYTFVTDVPGVYTYSVSVCSEGMPTCPTESLQITVMNQDSVNNPVANADIANVMAGNSIVIPSLDNDRAGTNGAPLNPASVVLLTAPTHGTASINDTTGAITYTPTGTFTGTDFLVYQVCDSNNNCASAEQRIHVKSTSIVNTTSASPDYFSATQQSVISGNVSINDVDPEGDSTTVVFIDTPTTAQGTITYAANGDFEFTPNPDFVGSIQLRYRSCDNGTPSACAEETLNLLYDKGYPNLSPTLSFSPSTIIGIQNVNVIASVYNFGMDSTTGLITLYIFKDSMMSLNFNPSATSLSGQSLNNSNWTFDNTSNSSFYILTSNSSISVPFGIQKLGFTATLDPNGTKGDLNLSIIIGSGSGGDKTNGDNISSTTLNYRP